MYICSAEAALSNDIKLVECPGLAQILIAELFLSTLKLSGAVCVHSTCFMIAVLESAPTDTQIHRILTLYHI